MEEAHTHTHVYMAQLLQDQFFVRHSARGTAVCACSGGNSHDFIRGTPVAANVSTSLNGLSQEQEKLGAVLELEAFA